MDNENGRQWSGAGDGEPQHDPRWRAEQGRDSGTQQFEGRQFGGQQFGGQQFGDQQYGGQYQAPGYGPQGPAAPGHGSAHHGGRQFAGQGPGSSGTLPRADGPGQPFGGQPGGPQQFGPADQAPARRGSGGRGLLAAGIVAGMLLSGCIGGFVGAAASGGGTDVPALSAPISGDQPPAKAPDGSVEAVAEKVRPSVVSIEVRGQSQAGEGSGVVLSNDGLIVTNNHVVDIAKSGGQIQVQFMDGTTAKASVVGTDPATDIAVVKADTSQALTPVTLGTSSTLKVGQAVAAVGSPLGLSGTVTTGIVSALDRPVRAGGSQSDQSTVIDAVQTDAAVNPGNSGGALVNMNGELIGINSAIASLGGGSGEESGSIGLGFAIPVDQARRIADQLIKQGHATRAVLGVSVTEPRGGTGAAVKSVEPGGPAAKAGIPQDALVTKVGDRVVDSGDGLVAAIRSHAPGDTVTVTYSSPGGTDSKTVDVTLGEAR